MLKHHVGNKILVKWYKNNASEIMIENMGGDDCIKKMVGCYFVINVYLEQSFKRQILNKAFQVVTPCSYKKITQTKNIITVW